MINSKKELKDWLSYEKQKYTKIHKCFILGLSGVDIIWKFQRRLRLTEYYKNCNKKIRCIISRIFLSHLANKYGLHIPCNTCGKGLKIMHLGPILINSRACIGNDATIHINTAVVAGGTSNEVPRLGNNIAIGVGAVVLGGITLANGIAIGANSVVNKSFLEENITIAGAPAKKISANGSDKWGSQKTVLIKQ